MPVSSQRLSSDKTVHFVRAWRSSVLSSFTRRKSLALSMRTQHAMLQAVQPLLLLLCNFQGFLGCFALFLECFLASPQTGQSGVVPASPAQQTDLKEPCPPKTAQVTSLVRLSVQTRCLRPYMLAVLAPTCWFSPWKSRFTSLYLWAYVPLWGAHWFWKSSFTSLYLWTLLGLRPLMERPHAGFPH